jgi:hypothetical protein
MVTKAIGVVAESSAYFYSSCPAHLTSPGWLATVHHFDGGLDKNERRPGASAHQGRAEILQVLAVQGEMPSRTDSLSSPSHVPRGPCMQRSSLQMRRTGLAKYN